MYLHNKQETLFRGSKTKLKVLPLLYVYLIHVFVANAHLLYGAYLLYLCLYD